MSPFKYGVLALISAALGCGAPAASSGAPTASFYAGAGSEWTAELRADQTITLLHFPTLGDPTADQLINAGVAPQTSGLDALSVTSSAGTGQPAEGASGDAVVAPGALFALAPFGGGPLVPMVSAGFCPGGAVAANLVKVKPAAGWTAAAGDASATFTYDPTSGVAALPARYTLGDANDPIAGGVVALGAGSCAGGIVTPSGGAEIFASAGGAVIVHTEPAAEATGGDEVWLGLPQAGGAVAPADLGGPDAGLLYVADATATNAPVALTLAANGTSADGTSAGVDLSLTSAGAADGLVTGTIALAGAAAQPLACVAQPAGDGTPALLACAASSAGGGFVSLVLASH